MEGGQPLSYHARREVVPGLRAHPACYIFIAWRDCGPEGL